MPTKDQIKRIYDERRSTHWCDADPADGLDGEPNACGPSIETLTKTAQAESVFHIDDFDPCYRPIDPRGNNRYSRLNFN